MVKMFYIFLYYLITDSGIYQLFVYWYDSGHKVLYWINNYYITLSKWIIFVSK